jgi:hypothetical protein
MSEVALDYKAPSLYGVIAKPKGLWMGMKFLGLTAGFAPSEEEALARVQKMWKNDREFREKWSGYQFLAFRSNFFVEITPLGATVLHRNEKELVKR